ncbi:MAG: hypothetical protein ACRCZJ_06945 [Erysipelotrichaceae bacterium]
MEYNVEIVAQNKQSIIIIHSMFAPVDMKREMSRAKALLDIYLDKHQIVPASPFFGRYFTYTTTQVEVDFGYVVAVPCVGEHEILTSTIPAGRWASILHFGSYRNLASSYQVLEQSLQKEELAWIPLAYEYYIKHAGNSESLSYETKLTYQLK